jgi:hypothetical protein
MPAERVSADPGRHALPEALVHASVDRDQRAVDVTGRRRREERDQCTELVGFAVPACRNAAASFRLDVLDRS